jgi:hypothetical protein
MEPDQTTLELYKKLTSGMEEEEILEIFREPTVEEIETERRTESEKYCRDRLLPPITNFEIEDETNSSPKNPMDPKPATRLKILPNQLSFDQQRLFDFKYLFSAQRLEIYRKANKCLSASLRKS